VGILQFRNTIWRVTFLTFLVSAFSFAADKTVKPDKSDDKPASNSDAGTSEDSGLAFVKGRELVLEGKLEEAVSYLEQALKEDPTSSFIAHQLAEVHFRLNNFDRAEVLARQAVDKEPANVEYRTTLGGIFASERKYNDAKEQYSKILEIDPSNQKAPLLIGILEAENGSMDKGIEVLTKNIDKNPDNYMALFYRAKIYLEMDDLKKAQADLDKCLTLRPNFVEAGTALGMLHERLGDVDKAIEVYTRIQGNGHFKKRLAQLYLQKNDFDKALQELLEYQKLEPDDYTARVKIALIYYELKKYETAQKIFTEILKEQPQADNVRFYLGAVYEELKKYDQAMVEFKKMTPDSTFFKEAMVHIGFLYKEQNHLKEGIEFSKKVLAKNPDVVEFYDMYASFYEEQKDYKKALGIIGDGIKKFPKDEKLLYFEGALYDKVGDRAHGIENMKKILEVNPNNAHALNFLGYTYAEGGEKLDEAEQLIMKAMSLRPNDGYIEDSLGWVQFKKGKVDDAVATLEKASANQPEEPIIQEHLGDVYTQKKDYDKAEESYRKALTLLKKDKETIKKIEQKIVNLPKEKRATTSDSDDSEEN
jgi:tetratricopeptide (TPR) repeat protein